MATKKHILGLLANLPDDAEVAFAGMLSKLDAEELYEYSEGVEIELTDSQWHAVVEEFECDSHPDVELLIRLIKEVRGS